MNQTILFKAPGRRSKSPIVILNTLNLTGKLQPRSSSAIRALLHSLTWQHAAMTVASVSGIAALLLGFTGDATGACTTGAMCWIAITAACSTPESAKNYKKFDR